MLWHSLDESGHIAVYDVEWPDGRVERDIPAMLLEKVKDSDDIEEAHEAHGVEGHRLDSAIDERKYKKKKKAKKRKKKKHSLYPYVFGYGYHRDAEDYDYDIGGDFGDFGGAFGDGGGGGE